MCGKCVAGAIKETGNFSWNGEKCVDHQAPSSMALCRIFVQYPSLVVLKKNMHHRCKQKIRKKNCAICNATVTIGSFM